VKDSNCRLFIATSADGEPLGQIRYDVRGTEAVISVTLAPQVRGRGYAPILIRRACREMFRDTPVELIHALVRVENEPSRKAFRRAGFTRSETTTSYGVPADHLFLRKEDAHETRHLPPGSPDRPGSSDLRHCRGVG
jgi:RimJ/RimL family protein N-acetyltransferase